MNFVKLNRVNTHDFVGRKFAQSNILCITLLYFTLLNNLYKRGKATASAYAAERLCMRTLGIYTYT